MSTKAAAGSSHLVRVLAHLNSSPKLTLTGLKSLRVALAYRNDHFGARHFVKEQLPRIQYANPNLDIKVEKLIKTKEEQWRPEMDLEYANGKKQKIDLHEKWSTKILKELMEAAGGEAWAKWKREASTAGLPLVSGEENENTLVHRPTLTQTPSLQAFRGNISSDTSSPSPTRTGVSAVLP